MATPRQVPCGPYTERKFIVDTYSFDTASGKWTITVLEKTAVRADYAKALEINTSEYASKLSVTTPSETFEINLSEIQDAPDFIDDLIAHGARWQSGKQLCYDNMFIRHVLVWRDLSPREIDDDMRQWDDNDYEDELTNNLFPFWDEIEEGSLPYIR